MSVMSCWARALCNSGILTSADTVITDVDKSTQPTYAAELQLP